MKNLYYCPECGITRLRDYSEEKRTGWCNVMKRKTTVERVRLDCSGFEVREASSFGGFLGKYYVSSLENMPEGLYLHKDLTVHKKMSDSTGKFQYTSKREAEERLRRFKEEMCLGSKAARDKKLGLGQFAQQKVSKLHLQLENETAPLVQPITARLVSDKSGGRIVLQVRTSESPEFIPIARLGVKNGKVVMYRERGVESEFINTDSEGRIQN